MEELIVGLLGGDAAVMLLAGTRTHWGRKPQGGGDAPYLVLQMIGGTSDANMQGGRFRQRRVQVDAYAKTYTLARDLGDAAMKALAGRRAGIIQGIFVDTEPRDLPAADAGEANHLFRRSFDIFVSHT